jgi:nucleotide-binding universal stress UspA family protein
MKFSKIMVAIDGSKESMHAANCAIGVAKKMQYWSFSQYYHRN